MRTTLDIEDDVLNAAKELARRQHSTAGQVISALLRRALTQPLDNSSVAMPETLHGFRPLPRRGAVVVTNELIDRLRDEQGV